MIKWQLSESLSLFAANGQQNKTKLLSKNFFSKKKGLECRCTMNASEKAACTCTCSCTEIYILSDASSLAAKQQTQFNKAEVQSPSNMISNDNSNCCRDS